MQLFESIKKALKKHGGAHCVSKQQATAGCHAYRLLKAAVKAPLGYGGAHCACKVDDSSASCMQMYESSSSSEDAPLYGLRTLRLCSSCRQIDVHVKAKNIR